MTKFQRPVSRTKLLCSASLSIAMLAFSGTAQAQTAEEAQSDNDDGVIVVTAQFREQNLQDTPLAITAVTGDMLDSRGQTSISDVAAQAPNVSLKPPGATFGPALAASIRGIGQTDSSLALDPGVGIYVDDVYYASMFGSMIDLLDLERVEILRGPQGTLAGQNSIGGAIKLFTRDPDGSGDGYAELTIGSFGKIKSRAAANFTISPDTLFARLSLAGQSQDGYVTNYDYNCVNPSAGAGSTSARADCVTGHEGGRNYTAGRLALRWLPSDSVEVNLSGDYTADRSEATPSVITAVDPAIASSPGLLAVAESTLSVDNFLRPDIYSNYANLQTPTAFGNAYGVDPRSYLTTYGVSAIIDIDLSDNLALKSISSYRYTNSDFRSDGDASPLGLSTPTIDQTVEQYTQELRLSGELADGAVEFTVGGFYLKVDGISYGQTNFVVPAGPPGVYFRNEFLATNIASAHSAAAFGNVSIHATDRLTLTGGLRYTDVRKEFVFANRTTPDLVTNLPSGSAPPFTGGLVDYRVALQYELTDDIMAYVQTSTGFKGGGVSPRALAPSQVQSFGVETVTTYEVGFKSQFLDRRIRLNAAAFYSEYTGIQQVRRTCDEFSPFPGFPCVLPANAGDAEISGFEIELNARPIDGLQIDGSLSYLDFDYTKLNFNTGIQFGDVTPFSSKWQWSVGIQYEIPVEGVGSLTPRFDLSYQSEFFSVAVNRPTNRVGGYALGNASLTWRDEDEDWLVSLGVTNLFEEEYFYNKFDALINFFGNDIAQPGRPREWNVTVRRNF